MLCANGLKRSKQIFSLHFQARASLVLKEAQLECALLLAEQVTEIKTELEEKEVRNKQKWHFLALAGVKLFQSCA